ncbi:hypothetical protein [Flavobacterium orientale]|uniref:Cytochrome oxidase Cu insertion factor, SCO1/SenC/PrrC family n=1 Tax=Flavobacterium orientale TaxID=1756020 RepID=A0A916Y7H2_9FLAO|nr:hypothetical protein [Flavobacterium orientale]GGD33628.1 hypothetical protein GCM10011343_24540 [Flavobacterium orientale]
MKKNIVLFVLFVLPIVAYLFFASGVNNFVKLPTITENIAELTNIQDIDGNPITFSEKITVLGFPGTQLLHNKGNAFNLSQKIYDKVKDFKDFQLVMLIPEGTEEQAHQLKTELSQISDLSRWHYVAIHPEVLKEFHYQLQLQETLDENFGTPNVYIIDKKLSLRGRKGKNKKGEEEYKEGYNTISAADLHNEMADDIKVILAEYRLALKKNSANREK